MNDSATSSPATPSAVGSRTALFVAWIVLLLAPLAVFHEVVFGGFTFSYSTFSCDPGEKSGGLDTMPVLDPGAAASQDESWLVLIQRTLRAGELPVVNLYNGLGAPLLESLQSGAWYPPNLVLLLLPGDSPWCFDLFVLLHVELLLAGLFVLLRLYARTPIALVLALVTGLSGVTYQHLDMVHYRSLVWLPWALAAAVQIARGSRKRRHALLFVGAHVCAVAAGAIQEAFLGSCAIALVFLAEIACDPTAVGERVRRTTRLAILAASSTLLAAPSFFPYLDARAHDDFFTQATPDRSTIPLDGDAAISLILPHLHGLFPHMLRIDRSIRWLTNFATCGAFLAVLAFLTIAARAPPRRRLFVVLAVAIAIAALKVQHVPWLDFVGSIPFLNEILFTKYHLSLFVLLAITAAIGLEEFASCPTPTRRRLVLGAAAAIAVLLGIAWAYVSASSSWAPFESLPEGVRTALVRIHTASIGAFVLCAAVLFASARAGMWAAALVVVAQAEQVAPYGWPKRLEEYWVPYDVERLVRTEPPPRALTMLPPNQNALIGIESISLFDPVHLRSVHRFFPSMFRVENAGFILHPLTVTGGLVDRELDAARFLGTKVVHGHALESMRGVHTVSENLHALEGTLPRAYVLTREAFERIDASVGRVPIGDLLQSVQRELGTSPAITKFEQGFRRVSFDVAGPCDGVLVVAQAHARGWSLDGVPARSFAQILCAWDLRLASSARVEVAYWPPGLRVALPMAGAGLVLLALACVLVFGARARLFVDAARTVSRP